ncbi:MAG: AAA family ATPase, partial [Candidatus Acidiferrum sp.]
PESVEYIDAANTLSDAVARQNHVIFGRRGCGKTLLLHESKRRVKADVRVVYVNCEDYKQHSFPNVLIEILDQLFAELDSNLSGWFGRKKRSRELIQQIRSSLSKLKLDPDERSAKVHESRSSETSDEAKFGAAYGIHVGLAEQVAQKAAIEREYVEQDSKLRELNLLLPNLKKSIREFFALSSEVKAVFLARDDFYHLPRNIQPHVADYIHRLCKDVPLYFKIATLRHASVLFADRNKQPIGVQERHDFQPINVDFTFENFKRTAGQLRQILYAYGQRAGMDRSEIDDLFMGEGFARLVLAAGGVPRDFLSLLLEALSTKEAGEERIGKDDVRQLSLPVFQRRIQELKVDAEQQDQDMLLKGINAITRFCLEKKENVFLVPDQALQEQTGLRELLNRLLDYRIIHMVGTALTHKSHPGTFAAYALDIGAYAKFRKLEGRFREIDITAADSRERCRNSPILEGANLLQLLKNAPPDPQEGLDDAFA